MTATFARREVTVHRVEFVVPAAAPWGAAFAEVEKAVTAARIELVERGVAERVAYLPADAVSVHPGDNAVIAVIVFYEVTA